jgi:hypothetical protein
MSDIQPDQNGEKRAKLAEDLFIILCIITLWPTILNWRNPFWEYLLYVALVGLVVIFFRRFKRFRQASQELDE